MSEQKRTREKAFGVAGSALNLAQDLLFHAKLRNPKKIRLKYRFLPWVWWKEMHESHEYFELLTGAAYELYNEVMDWADEYPLVEGEKE
jgi:hypothetical protein